MINFVGVLIWQKMPETVYCSIQKCYNLAMKIYHGSKQIINKPKPFGSKKDNDYGPAFYLTRDLQSAHEWACRNNSIGYVNEYDISFQGLKVLDLTDKTQFSVLNWVAILLHFRYLDSGFIKAFSKRLLFIERKYYIDVQDFDVVIGYRADDAYFRFPLDFIRGNLTLEQLSEAFNLGELGIQYVLISEKAINKLKYRNSFLSNEKYIVKYFDTVKRATKQFDSFDKDEDGVRIQDIMKGE